MARLDDITSTHTLAVVKAALSGNPDAALRDAAIVLATQELTPVEVGAVYAGVTGHVASLLRHIVSAQTARQQLLALATTATTIAAFEAAVEKMPRDVRRTNRKKKK